ncbi:OB-fold nucleic acid binding domain-containing protein, partial [Bradyrhizobium sp.]|uniref:helix-hairpin-helix domain-containing protein n=1 Tax=Bradyrhizobium sp. TaxID=376 RepID=UPI003C75ACB8
APAQIVGDARKNGVEVREIDVSFSYAQNTLEERSGEHHAVRLGFRQIDGFRWRDPDEERLKRIQASFSDAQLRIGDAPEAESHLVNREGTALPLPLAGEGWGGGVSTIRTVRVDRASPTRIASFDAMRPKSELRSSRPPQAGEVKTDWAERIVAARKRRPFTSLEDFARDTALPKRALILLADADAFRSLGLDRRAALWAVRRLPDDIPLPLFETAAAREQPDEEAQPLPLMPLSEHVVADYQTIRLSLKGHPMEFLRPRFERERVIACASVSDARDRQYVRCAGVVLVRQRPGSAKGVVFMTLEDETGIANIVVWPKVMERFRKEVMGARLVLVEGYIQSSPEKVVHLVAERLFDCSRDLVGLANDAFSRKPAVPVGPALIEPLNDDPREHPDHPAQKIRHPRNVRILPPSRDFH